MDDKLRDAPEGFIAWFRANYRDVVDFGSDPAWHAKAIYKNVMHHARAALAAPVSAQPEAVQAAARRLLDKDAPDIYAGDVRLVAEAVLAAPPAASSRSPSLAAPVGDPPHDPFDVKSRTGYEIGFAHGFKKAQLLAAAGPAK